MDSVKKPALWGIFRSQKAGRFGDTVVRTVWPAFADARYRPLSMERLAEARSGTSARNTETVALNKWDKDKGAPQFERCGAL